MPQSHLIARITLLNSLFHTDRVYDKLKVLENFWLMALNEAQHCLIRDCPLAETAGATQPSLPMISNGYH